MEAVDSRSAQPVAVTHPPTNQPPPDRDRLLTPHRHQGIPPMKEGGRRRILVPAGPLQQQGTKSLVWMVGMLGALEEAGGGWGLAVTGWLTGGVGWAAIAAPYRREKCCGACCYVCVCGSISTNPTSCTQCLHLHAVEHHAAPSPLSNVHPQSSQERGCPQPTWSLRLS